MINRLLLYRIVLLLLFLPGAAGAGYGQTEQGFADFPADFVGVWQGEVTVYNAGGKQQQAAMELRIAAIDDSTYTYEILYGQDTTQTRRYIIKRGAEGPHHWVCDERNGIFLDGYHVGGLYQSVFTVMGSTLVGSLAHRGDFLEYTFQTFAAEPVRASGGANDADQEVPEVKSYGVKAVNRAELHRLE